jgi:hypothetical protein
MKLEVNWIVAAIRQLAASAKSAREGVAILNVIFESQFSLD